MKRFLDNARKALLSERNADGHWRGELSSSALSTATAVIALALVSREAHSKLIDAGLGWLEETQNEDGGWGDTVRSFSNISTTLLCWSAFGANDRENEAAESWIRDQTGSLEPDAIAAKVVARYGKDKTFSVPILMACTLGGRLGNEAWKLVPGLPFELAACPRAWFAALQLPVVSYALPALIAIGQVIHTKHPHWFPLTRVIRSLARKRTLRILEQIQPSSGGYLEATPLTSFVTMALAGCGHTPKYDTPAGRVMQRAVTFLESSARADGSWPIDTDLATWVTTLSLNALSPGGALSTRETRVAHDWLLRQQYRDVHAFTMAKPGGWAWTDLPGGVPDADDTSGAVLALSSTADAADSAESAAMWLLDLQNRDGGMPTFCKGWGALPFDRSCNDITAHALAAWAVWEKQMAPPVQARIQIASERAVAFLAKNQLADGSWLPLWFGNQHVDEEANPTYGTARVLIGLAKLDVSEHPELPKVMKQAAQWLRDAQNPDGSWGGGRQSPPSVEETSLAAEALLAHSGNPKDPAVQAACEWLSKRTHNGTRIDASPIGFYFAKLWYFERLYPKIFLVSFLERLSAIAKPQPPSGR